MPQGVPAEVTAGRKINRKEVRKDAGWFSNTVELGKELPGNNGAQ